MLIFTSVISFQHLGWRDVSNAGATNISESKWGPPPDKTKTKRSTESIVWENYRTPSQEHHNSGYFKNYLEFYKRKCKKKLMLVFELKIALLVTYLAIPYVGNLTTAKINNLEFIFCSKC